MVLALISLEDWPIGLFGDPVLKSTDDAFLYAKLIWQSVERKEFLISLRNKVRKSCETLLKDEDPDYDLISSLACLSQFYRECLEECKRIQEGTE